MTLPVDDLRVHAQSFTVRPACFEEMGRFDKDAWCLVVGDGGTDGWWVRRHGARDGRSMSRAGHFVRETPGPGRNRDRRWPLEQALQIALEHVDSIRVHGLTAAEAATRHAARNTGTRLVA